MTIFNQVDPATAEKQGTAGVFPSPWLDPASHALPNDINEIFRFCELLWYANGIYSQALTRVSAFFVTRVKVDGLDKAETERWLDFLENTFHINRFMCNVGRNNLAYGNVMMSPQMSVARMLRCRQCGQTAPLSQWDYKFDKLTFSTRRCPRCGGRGPLERIDLRPMTSDAVGIRIWNPHTMRVKHNGVTGKNVYRHVLPNDDAEPIRQGDPDVLEDTPWEFVQCAVDRRPLRLHPEYIFHLQDTPLAGVNTRGLGLPRAMANFRQAYHGQVLQRLNMVLGMEYSTPLRSLTPGPRAAAELDPSMGVNMESLSHKLTGMVAAWKRDPAAIHTFPVPIQYSAWGGEGMQLATHEIQNQVMEQLLSGLGIPVDFFVGSFKNERMFAPTLRLMERTWAELVSGYDATLGWVADTFSRLLRWKKPQLSMESVTAADDIELRQILLDLYMNGRISGRTGLGPLKLDPVTENREMVREQIDMQTDADVAAMRQDAATQNLSAVNSLASQQQQPTEAGGGGMTGPGTLSNTPQRPDDILARAEQIAGELLQQPPEQRRPQLTQLRNEDSLLHDAVVQAMDRMRQQRGTDAAQFTQPA
ncbi:MAG: hypothetical protein WC992_00350 [Acholeplasmataceae bacterium]|jgi:hypothetical protein